MPVPTLHMLCGKIGSGKSTLAKQLAQAPGTMLVVEDAWLHALFSDQMTSIRDFVLCAGKLRQIMGPHIADLLNAGVSVVLDAPANTVENRAWMRRILNASNAAHQLHVLNTPDDICLARMRARNARGDHPFAPTEDQFHIMSRHYEPPTADEGFTIVLHDGES